MKKIYVVGLALFAVLAFGALSASSAFAETEWLLNGAPITGEDSVLTIGNLILDVLVGGLLVVAIECSGDFDGTVGPGAQDLILKVFSLAGVEVGAPLTTGTGLSCEVLTSTFNECGAVGSLAEVWPINLPWTTTLELVGGVLLDDFPPTSGYEVLCSGGKENKCEGLAQALVSNETGGVLGEFTEATNEATCTVGVGHVGSSVVGLTELLTGDTGTLTVS
jgi:hypothetical protein